jgi:hypothetical protein
MRLYGVVSREEMVIVQSWTWSAWKVDPLDETAKTLPCPAASQTEMSPALSSAAPSDSACRSAFP